MKRENHNIDISIFSVLAVDNTWCQPLLSYAASWQDKTKAPFRKTKIIFSSRGNRCPPAWKAIVIFGKSYAIWTNIRQWCWKLHLWISFSMLICNTSTPVRNKCVCTCRHTPPHKLNPAGSQAFGLAAFKRTVISCLQNLAPDILWGSYRAHLKKVKIKNQNKQTKNQNKTIRSHPT